jgi:hypothetical protein
MKRCVVLSLALMLLQACGSMPQRAAADFDVDRADVRTTIFVARRGWHIDIGFRTLDIQERLISLSAPFARSQYLFFGFGDRHYLVAKNKNFPGLLAALWPGAAVVLVTALAGSPEEAFGSEHVIRLTVSSAAAQAAQTFVWNSLRTQNNAPAFSGKGPYAGSLFIGAVPKYSAVHTCNTWAAEVLRAADLSVHSHGVVFAAQLWPQVRRLEHGMPTLSSRVAPSAGRASLQAPSLAPPA